MNLYRPKNTEFDFSDEKVYALEESVSKLKEILSKAGFDSFNQSLTNILSAASKRDDEKFKGFSLTNELFGGSGSLWEIWIGNEQQQHEFEERFVDFVNNLKNMGLRNRRMSQVLEGVEKRKR